MSLFVLPREMFWMLRMADCPGYKTPMHARLLMSSAQGHLVLVEQYALMHESEVNGRAAKWGFFPTVVPFLPPTRERLKGAVASSRFCHLFYFKQAFMLDNELVLPFSDSVLFHSKWLLAHLEKAIKYKPHKV